MRRVDAFRRASAPFLPASGNAGRHPRERTASCGRRPFRSGRRASVIRHARHGDGASRRLVGEDSGAGRRVLVVPMLDEQLIGGYGLARKRLSNPASFAFTESRARRSIAPGSDPEAVGESGFILYRRRLRNTMRDSTALRCIGPGCPPLLPWPWNCDGCSSRFSPARNFCAGLGSCDAIRLPISVTPDCMRKCALPIMPVLLDRYWPGADYHGLRHYCG